MSKTKEKEICSSRNIMRLSPLLFTLALVCTAASKSLGNLHLHHYLHGTKNQSFPSQLDSYGAQPQHLNIFAADTELAQ